MTGWGGADKVSLSHGPSPSHLTCSVGPLFHPLPRLWIFLCLLLSANVTVYLFCAPPLRHADPWPPPSLVPVVVVVDLVSLASLFLYTILSQFFSSSYNIVILAFKPLVFTQLPIAREYMLLVLVFLRPLWWHAMVPSSLILALENRDDQPLVPFYCRMFW